MSVLPIVPYPDRRLKTRAEPVGAITDGVRILARDLLDTLYSVPALGLAAPHVGVLKRVVAIDLGEPGRPTPVIYLDPEVVSASSDFARHREGSVSMPGVSEEVERPARIRARWRDLDGAEREEDLAGLAAACLLHEIDQLDGVFWIERLSRLKRERVLKRFAKFGRS
jgi:peptide deformylase